LSAGLSAIHQRDCTAEWQPWTKNGLCLKAGCITAAADGFDGK